MLMLVVGMAAITCVQACQQQVSQLGPFEFLDKLSSYGFFVGETKNLQPAARVLHYTLNTPLFTDYALKDRFIVVPANKEMQYKDSGVLDFPDSTFIIKNFAYRNEAGAKVMIETRLLFKDPQSHEWKVMNYIWDDKQSDATKLIVGKKVPIKFLDDDNQLQQTVYQVPNTNDCKRCHINNSDIQPIGPKVRNMHIGDQLRKWATAGYLKGLPAEEQIPTLPNWQDSAKYTLAERARAYLDVNCAHCHTQTGDAFNTGLFLEYDQHDKNKLGFMKNPVSAGAGAGGMDFDIVPGHAHQSILAYRMNSVEPGTAMPELARTVIHKEGVQLIVEWINSLPKQ